MQRSLIPLLLTIAVGAASPAAAQNPRLRAVADAVLDSIAPRDHDPDAIVANLLQAAIDAAQSPAAEVAIHHGTRHTDVVRDLDAVLQGIDRFLSASPHGLAAQRAIEWKADILERLGRYQTALGVGAYDSYVDRLLVAGPFGDSADDFTSYAYSPEFAPWLVAGQSFGRGRYAEVVVEEVSRKPHERFIDVSETTSARWRPGCYYAQHAVRSDEPRAVHLEVRTSGSFELFVNGERVAVVHRPAEPTAERLFFPLRLGAGDNQVLVKLTTAGRDTLALRFVDAAGAPVELAEGGRGRATGASDAPALPPLQDGCDALLAAARDVAAQPAIAIAALRTCLDADRTSDATRLVRAFESAPPSDPDAAAALALTVDRVRALPPELRVARVRELLETHEAALADHHAATIRRSYFLQDEDRFEDSIRLLQQRLASHPDEPGTYAALHRAYGRLDFDAEAHRLARTWAEALPHDYRAYSPLVRARSVRDPRGTFEMLTEALEIRPGEERLMRDLLGPAALLGETETRDRILDALHRHEPDGTLAHRTRSWTLTRSGDHAAALDHDAATATHPRARPDRIAQAADRLLRGGREAEAVAAYERALELEPERHATRRACAWLAGQDEEFPFVARFRRDADAAIAAFEPGEAETTSSATLVLDQMIVRFYPDGSFVREVQLLYRINDQRGVDYYSQAYDVSNAAETILVRTVGADGSVYVPNKVNGSFTFPRLEPGAFTHEVYRDFFDAPGAGAIGEEASFYFQSAGEPYRVSEFVAILPNGLRGEWRSRQLDFEPEVVELADDHTAFVYRVTDVPRLPTESFAPPLAEIVPYVRYGEDSSVAARARDSYATALERTRTTAWVTAKARELADGSEGDSAIARRLYAWIHEAIEDGRGGDPTWTLLRGRGPRFPLFVAMLSALDVPFRHAAMAVTRDELSEAATPLFLGADEFPVPAIRIEPRDGAPMWAAYDNARYEPLGSIAPERRGAAAILLGPGEHELTRLPAGESNLAADLGWTFRGEVTLQDGGNAEFRLTGAAQGDVGYNLADRIRDLPRDQTSAVARQVATQIVRGWTLDHAELGNLGPGMRFAVSANYSQRGAVSEDGLVELPIVRPQLVGQFAPNAERELPLDFRVLEADDWTIRFDPGDAYRIADVPRGIDLKTDHIDFSLSFRRDGDGILISLRSMQRPGTIPTSAYADFRRVLATIDRATAAKIRVVPTGE